MLKIRALNRESSTDEDAAPLVQKEAQEEIALEAYNKALRLQSSKTCDPNNLEQARQLLQDLIEENIPQLENHGGLPSSMSTLKYSCFYNLGHVNYKLGKVEEALDNYLKASDLDPSDVTLWHKIGKLALKMGHHRQSAFAFFRGLECNDSHWPCLDQIVSILYALKDTVACLEHIGRALILDPNYTKGLVLRKQIHADNPGTLVYYQKYNPDHIWEPPLEVTIEPTTEHQILDEVQILCDEVTSAEKAVGPKPLETIALPVAMSDFTWLSLGAAAIGLHRYLTDHGMTHFTFVDLSKCMSHTEDDDNKMEAEVIEEKIAADETPPPEEALPNLTERRASQNSDATTVNNNDLDKDNTTPTQTDNDEEQATMDQDDQEDNNMAADDGKRGVAKIGKRKRDLVSELQIWGWHSKRRQSKKGKPDKDFTIEEALNRIIPDHLLRKKLSRDNPNQEDSMNTMDMYNIYVAEERDNNILSPVHSPTSSKNDSYFGSDSERRDVEAIWKKDRSYCDAVLLVRDFVIELSKLWRIKWPEELVGMYIDAYCMFREHFVHPEVFCGGATFDELRDDALATLLYGELVNFSSVKNETRTISVTSLAFLQWLSTWETEWQAKGEHPQFFLRFYWLRAHIFRKEGDSDLAIRALTLVQELIEDHLLVLPNCFKCASVSLETVSKILKHLDIVTSLDCIDELYKAEKYKEVAEILKITFTSTSHPVISGKNGRPAEIAILMHSLWYTDLVDCFKWTEECLCEALRHWLNPTTHRGKWELLLEKCLVFLHEIIKLETVIVVDSLSPDKRARLVENLCQIACKQLNSTTPFNVVTPWIVLHFVLLRDEHREAAKRKVSHVKVKRRRRRKSANESASGGSETDEGPGDEVPPSAAILFSAHEFLGPKGWCLSCGGDLLHFMLDNLLDSLDAMYEHLRDKIDIHVEQALFCLYQHPSKKNKISRHLADHNVDPLPLTWERAFQLYQFYGPDCLPEFNSYKNASISSDMEQLLQRIIALVPQEMDPQPRVPRLCEYIHGKSDDLPEPIDFSYKMRAIYYLIGDYYFKQREFNRCIKYFLMDLCINPKRVDSWACIGLSYISQLESKLNYCKRLKSEMEFLDKAKCAQNSFKKALELEPEHIMLWIEYGSFEYMVHSFCSRVMKSESDTLSMEKFDYLENQKNHYLESSGRSFERAIQLYRPDESEADERWLQYYILGKVAEKTQKEPSEYLQHYRTAGDLLHENEATYPDKINYHNPQHLAVEVLEIYYRSNASILKYLELHEGKDIHSTVGRSFKESLDSFHFPKKMIVKECTTTPQQQSLKTKHDDIRRAVKECLMDLLSKVEAATSSVNSVIVLGDSDEDRQPPKKTEDVAAVVVVKNAQEVLDSMMEETMKGLPDDNVESDTDTSPASAANVVTAMAAQNGVASKVKSSSETDRTSSTSTSGSSSSSSSSSESGSDGDDDDDSSSSSSTSSSQATADAKSGKMTMTVAEISTLVDRCIVGLEQCIIRLPQNYKALYRLSHLYFNYKPRLDLVKSKQLLLGEYTCKGGVAITGLFSDRKTHNFFNGIWRIPSSEIDRPGSLSAHMSRCVSLLLQILRTTNDNKLLLDLSIQFRKIPDPDKIYIKDSERVQFADQAMAMCVQTLRSQMQEVATASDSTNQKLLQDIFWSYQRVQKHDSGKEATFGGMLTEVYKKIRKDKLPDTVNVLDLATRYCQQMRVIEKQKKVPVMTNPVMRPPGMVTTAPVLPAPSTVAPPPHPPFKRPPTMGRPRGRPPLSKVTPPSKLPRGRSPTSSSSTSTYPWLSQKSLQHNTSATYNYLKQYQDELIKQYSQSLNLSQLSQLNQFFTNQMIQNPFPFLGGGTTSSGGSGLSPMLANQMLLGKTMEATKFGGKSSGTGGKSQSSSKKTTPTYHHHHHHHHQLSMTRPQDATPSPNLLMKDRPNISITPVMSAPSTVTSSSSVGGKTLQEKLADKQKQLSSSPTVIKASSYKFPLDSGISISQIPMSRSGARNKSRSTITMEDKLKRFHKTTTRPDDDDDVILID